MNNKNLKRQELTLEERKELYAKERKGQNERLKEMLNDPVNKEILEELAMM